MHQTRKRAFESELPAQLSRQRRPSTCRPQQIPPIVRREFRIHARWIDKHRTASDAPPTYRPPAPLAGHGVAMSTAARRDATAAKEFPWPAPPYFEFLPGKGGAGWSDCVLTFRDGGTLSGRLHRFLANAATLTFQPSDSSVPLTIPFSELLKLQLPRPVGLRRETLPAAATSAETEELRRSERYAFQIELVKRRANSGQDLGLCQRTVRSVPVFPGSKRRCRPLLRAGAGGEILQHRRAPWTSAGRTEGGFVRSGSRRAEPADDDAHAKAGSIPHAEQIRVAGTACRGAGTQARAPGPETGRSIDRIGPYHRAGTEFGAGGESLERSMPIGQILLKKMGIVDEQAIIGAIANRSGVPTVDLNTTIPLDILARIPAAVAHRHYVVPCVRRKARSSWQQRIRWTKLFWKNCVR